MTPSPTSTSAERRTQAQRREGTIGALLDATVSCLAERGYAATSTAAVCAEAGVSQGALFRHFPTRHALLVATAAHVATRNVEAFRATVGADVDTVVVMEAMKMEQPLKAHKAGTVTGLRAEVGATVTNGAVICELKD